MLPRKGTNLFMKDNLYAGFSKKQIDKAIACSNQEELLKLFHEDDVGLHQGHQQASLGDTNDKK